MTSALIFRDILFATDFSGAELTRCPGLACGSNSTRRSTSLSVRAAPFRAEPKTERRLIRRLLQTAARASRSGNSVPSMTSS